MQIVIDIPEEMVKALEQGCFGAKYNIYDLCGCVMRGTPLPKGHGRLIDADALKTKLIREAFIGAEIEMCGHEDAITRAFDNAPTIIQADKEEGR